MFQDWLGCNTSQKGTLKSPHSSPPGSEAPGYHHHSKGRKLPGGSQSHWRASEQQSWFHDNLTAGWGTLFHHIYGCKISPQSCLWPQIYTIWKVCHLAGACSPWHMQAQDVLRCLFLQEANKKTHLLCQGIWQHEIFSLLRDQWRDEFGAILNWS